MHGIKIDLKRFVVLKNQYFIRNMDCRFGFVDKGIMLQVRVLLEKKTSITW